VAEGREIGPPLSTEEFVDHQIGEEERRLTERLQSERLRAEAQAQTREAS
jgi:hypothetical protein